MATQYKTIHLVEKCRQMVVASGLASKIGLVVVSPMTRTLQTAAGVFGEREIYDDNGEAKPILMKKGKTNPCTRAKPSTKSPPFVAQELCREHIMIRPLDLLELNPWSLVRARLMSREEKEMAVVSHSYFLHEFLRAISGSSTSDLGWLENCELQTIVIESCVEDGEKTWRLISY
ncbi:hypothetical protein SELMODRAFT_423410 [Selaginella moellendorffii]|uniref:Uncharacterized protein n=1 Tax=Selaginella moellendorffii TaxID=88036 RepID=D8SLM3_SELML|nr:hypothetical protein SELMODRAFT_423410 [Selaginella moellendorffii]